MNLRLLLAVAALALPAAAQFAINDAVLPQAIIGAPYPAVEITTINGTGPIQWSFILAPSPPGGFVIGPSAAGGNVTSASFCFGVLDGVTGRPVCQGNVLGFPGGYLINVRARDANGQIASRVFNLTIVQTLSIVTVTLPDAVVGQPYSAVLEGAGGTGNYTWALEGGDLPLGLTLNSLTGAITGTAPNTAGATTFGVRMTDTQTGANVHRIFTLNVLGGLRITTTALPLAIAGQPIAPFQMTAVGGTNLTWSISVGWELPDFFELSADGVLSGGRGSPGAHKVSIRVQDNTSGLADERLFDLFVTLGLLRIVETSLPVAAVNVPYTTTLTAFGGLPPYQWTFGSLANQGLVIDPDTGTITGTPPQLGLFQIPVNLTDSTGARFTALYTLQVVNTVTIATSSFPNATVGAPFLSTLTAVGGQAPYRWSITSGVLPPGLTLDTVQGTINGTPTTEGAFQFTLFVSDAGGRFATRQLGIVVGRGISIATTSLADGVVGTSYAAALQATGGLTPFTWAIVGGSLPSGLSFDAATGVISGVPTAVFNGNLTFRVTDSGGNSDQRSLALNIAPQLAILTNAIPGGSRNAPYSFTLTSVGGRAPYNWSVTSGNLPPGLQLATATGVISGTPTAAGSYAFTVELGDAGGQLARANFLLNIAEPLTITTGSINGTAGQVLSQTLAASGGSPPYTFSQTGGSLPPGLSLNSGTVSGTPTQAGIFNVTFQVRDQAQQTATRAIAITIGVPSLPAVTITGLDGAVSGGQSNAPLRIDAPYPVEITGTLTLQFASSLGGADDTVRFANGSRTIPFTIPAGSTQAVFSPGPNATVLTGTTAGTITVTANFQAAGQTITPSPAPARSVTVAQRAPVVSSVTVQRSGNTITAIVTGYTNTREISSGVFRFTATGGGTLQQSEFTVSLTTAFGAWFGNAGSHATGGQFRLTVPFNISVDAGSVSLTNVTLTNSAGSATASP